MTIKRTNKFLKILLFLLFVGALTGCSNETPGEAINNGWSDEIKVNNVLSKQKLNEGTIALFTAKGADHSQFNYVGVSLLKAQHDHDWEFIDSDMTAITEDFFSATHRVFHFETEDGNIKEMPIVFGVLKNENIATVTAEVNDEKKEIDIITTHTGRYFYQVNAWGPIEFLNKNGEVMDRYGI
ncbi:hypothetical protein [Halobacillus halophilus]|uniref:hypothetical protein n=1 Tax=Halobacillus halophilus TaxID=1570 RepID=UPI001CD1C264|nr:hypothetical protein [Halobacillus halophilus]MCA1011678.1 hypothetical protein [Halobacillus halophilus]